eukprot:5732252-Amphidinium_carterae.1
MTSFGCAHHVVQGSISVAILAQDLWVLSICRCRLVQGAESPQKVDGRATGNALRRETSDLAV